MSQPDSESDIRNLEKVGNIDGVARDLARFRTRSQWILIPSRHVVCGRYITACLSREVSEHRIEVAVESGAYDGVLPAV